MPSLDEKFKKYEKYGVVGDGHTLLAQYHTNVEDYPRLPFDVFPIDYALGGGLPVCSPVQIYGPPDAGKSLFSTLLARSLTKHCLSCLRPLALCSCGKKKVGKTVLVYAEGVPPEQRWYNLMQYDTSHMKLCIPDYGEQGCDIILDALQADDVGLIIVDSTADLRPKKELECDFLDDTMGLHSKLISRLFYKMKRILPHEFSRGHFCGLLFINQMRAKYNAGMFESKEQAPGSFASKHGFKLSLRIGQLSLKTDAEERDKASNRKNILKFSMSLLGESTKQQIFVMAGKAEYKVSVSNWKGYSPGQAVDAKLLRESAQALDMLIPQSKGYKLKGTKLEFDKLSDFEDVIKTGIYNGKRVGIDTIIRFLITQEAKRDALTDFEDKSGVTVLSRKPSTARQKLIEKRKGGNRSDISKAGRSESGGGSEGEDAA